MCFKNISKNIQIKVNCKALQTQRFEAIIGQFII